MSRGCALARIAVLGGGLFVASAAVSIGELRYAIWGKTTTADFRNTVASACDVRAWIASGSQAAIMPHVKDGAP